MPAREGLERDRVKSGTWRTTHALGREHQKHALTYTGEELFGGTSSNPQTGPEGWGSGTEAKQEPRGEDNRKQQVKMKAQCRGLSSQVPLVTHSSRALGTSAGF